MGDVIKWLGEQLGTILGFLGLVSGFIFWWISRKPKQFGWQGISTTRIVSSKGRSLPLKITYAGKDVFSPNITVIRLGNIGKAPITVDDYDGPVQVSFTKGELLAYDVSEKFNENISLDIEQNEDASISIKPSLLNPGEWFDLQFITDGPIETPTVKARIAGQTGPITEAIKKQETRWKPFYRLSMVVFSGTPVLLITLGILDQDFENIIMPGFILGLILVLASVVLINRKPAWSKHPSKRSRRTEHR